MCKMIGLHYLDNSPDYTVMEWYVHLGMNDQGGIKLAAILVDRKILKGICDFDLMTFFQGYSLNPKDNNMMPDIILEVGIIHSQRNTNQDHIYYNLP